MSDFHTQLYVTEFKVVTRDSYLMPIPAVLVLVKAFSPHVMAVIKLLQIACSIVFIIGGITEFTRSNGGFQPLDISEAGKAMRPIIAIVEILCGIALFLPEYTTIAALTLLVFCVGAAIFDTTVIRRSPMLPVLCIVLAVVAFAHINDLDSWRYSPDPFGSSDSISK